jgi:hypothetical protein
VNGDTFLAGILAYCLSCVICAQPALPEVFTKLPALFIGRNGGHL